MKPNIPHVRLGFLTLCMLVWAPALVFAADANKGKGADDAWKIEIRPRTVLSSPSAEQAQPKIRPASFVTVESITFQKETDVQGDTEIASEQLAKKYYEVYRSIPFLRSEYNANPSYRHETTMEILFGELRPMTIHKYTPIVPPAPAPLGPYWRRGGTVRHSVTHHLFYRRYRSRAY